MKPINKLTNPLDYVLHCCEQGLVPETFDLLNAKDELKRIRQRENIVAWVRINDRGDLYDPRLQLNPFVDENTIIPLYANKEELKKLLDKSR